MKPVLVVMAAGLGSRFGGPKQLEPVGPGGELIMDYAVFDALRAGIERVVFVIRREMEPTFHALMGGRYASRMDVAYAHQELDMLPAGFPVPGGRTKPWGTGHAVLSARQAVGPNPFIAINADDFYGAHAFRTLAGFLDAVPEPGAERHAMVGFRLSNTLSEHGTVARGICSVDGRGRLMGVTEHTGLAANGEGASERAADGSILRFTGAESASMNFWGFRPSIFGELEARFEAFLRDRGTELRAEFFLPSVVDALIREGRATLDVLPTPGRWFGVTYREDKPAVVEAIARLVAAGEYPLHLWS